MKYIPLIFGLIVSSFFIRCNKSGEMGCRMDLEFITSYQNCIVILTKARHGLTVNFNDRLRAIECLESITLIESNIIKYSDTPYLLYKIDSTSSIEQDLFNADLENWSDWLSKNRCSYNMEDSKNAFAARSKIIGVDLNWPTFHYE